MKYITNSILEKYSPYISLESAKLLCVENEALDSIINPKNSSLSLISQTQDDILDNILKLILSRNKLTSDVLANFWELFPEAWWVDFSYNSINSLPPSAFPFVLGSLDLRGNPLTLSHIKNISSVHILKLHIDIKHPENMSIELLRTASSLPNIFVLNNQYISSFERQLILSGQVPQYETETLKIENIIFDDNSVTDISPREESKNEPKSPSTFIHLEFTKHNSPKQNKSWKTNEGWRVCQATERQASFLTIIHSMQNPTLSNDFLKLEILLEDYLHDALYHNHHQDLLERSRKINPKTSKAVSLTQNSSNFLINSLEKMPTLSDIEILFHLPHSIRLDLSVILSFLIIFPLTIPKLTCISLLEHLLLPHNISKTDILNMYEMPSYIKTSIVSILRRITRKEYEEWIEGGSTYNMKMKKKPTRNIEEIVRSTLINAIRAQKKSNIINIKKKKDFFLKTESLSNKNQIEDEFEEDIYTYEGLIDNFPTPTYEGSEGFLFLRSIKEYLQINDGSVDGKKESENDRERSIHKDTIPLLPFSEIEIEILNVMPDCPTLWIVYQDIHEKLHNDIKNDSKKLDNGIGVGDASIFDLNVNSLANWVSFSARHISLLINRFSLCPSLLRMPNSLHDMNKYLDLFGLLYIGGMSFIDLEFKNTGSLINGRSDGNLMKKTNSINMKNFDEKNKKLLDKMLNNNVNEFKILNISSSRRIFRLQAMKKLLSYDILPFGVGLPKSTFEDLVWNIQNEEKAQEDVETNKLDEDKIKVDTNLTHTNFDINNDASNFFLTGNNFEDSYVSPITNQSKGNFSPPLSPSNNLATVSLASMNSGYTQPTEFLNKFHNSVKNVAPPPISPNKNNKPSSPVGRAITPIVYPKDLQDENLNLYSQMSIDSETENLKYLNSENTLGTFSTNINKLKSQIEESILHNTPQGYSTLWNASEENILNYQDYLQKNSSVLKALDKETLVDSLSTELDILNQFPPEYHIDKKQVEKKNNSPHKINQNLSEKLKEFHTSLVNKHQTVHSSQDLLKSSNGMPPPIYIPNQSVVKSSQVEVFSNSDAKVNTKDNFLLAPSSSIKLFNLHIDSIKAQETILKVKTIPDNSKWNSVRDIPIAYVNSNDKTKSLSNFTGLNHDQKANTLFNNAEDIKITKREDNQFIINEASQFTNKEDSREVRPINPKDTNNNQENKFNSKRFTANLIQLGESIGNMDHHASITSKTINNFSDLISEIKKSHFKVSQEENEDIKEEVLVFNDENTYNEEERQIDEEIEDYEYNNEENNALEEVEEEIIIDGSSNEKNNDIPEEEKEELRIMTNLLYDMGTLRNLRDLEELNYMIKNSKYDQKKKRIIRPTKKISILKPLKDILGNKVLTLIEQPNLTQLTRSAPPTTKNQNKLSSSTSAPSFFVTNIENEEDYEDQDQDQIISSPPLSPSTYHNPNNFSIKNISQEDLNNSKLLYSNNIGLLEKTVKSSGTVLYPLVQKKNLLKVSINESLPPFINSLNPERTELGDSPKERASSQLLFENSVLTRAPTYVENLTFDSFSDINNNNRKKLKKNKIKNNLSLLKLNSSVFNQSLKKAIDTSDNLNEYENINNELSNSSSVYSFNSLESSEGLSHNLELNTIYTPLSTNIVDIGKKAVTIEPPSIHKKFPLNLSSQSNSIEANDSISGENISTNHSENASSIRMSIIKNSVQNSTKHNTQYHNFISKSSNDSSTSPTPVKLVISSSTSSLKPVNLNDPTAKVKPHRRLASLSGEKEKGVWVGLDNYKKSTTMLKPNPNFKVTLPRHIQEVIKQSKESYSQT